MCRSHLPNNWTCWNWSHLFLYSLVYKDLKLSSLSSIQFSLIFLNVWFAKLDLGLQVRSYQYRAEWKNDVLLLTCNPSFNQSQFADSFFLQHHAGLHCWSIFSLDATITLRCFSAVSCSPASISEFDCSILSALQLSVLTASRHFNYCVIKLTLICEEFWSKYL